jgi:hypothetical protein
VRPADVRFYIDADLLGLGKVLASLRSDVTYPGDVGAALHGRQRPACSIDSPATPDSVWIPVVSHQSLVIITRDRRIQLHQAEINAIVENNGRMVTLSSEDAGTTWAQLEVVMSQWRRIEGLVGQPGPFIYTATRTRFEPVVLSY